MNELPMIRLTIDHMRQEMIHAFNLHADGLKDRVATELDAAIARFDFAAEVERMAGGILRDQIRLALDRAFAGLSWDESLRKALIETMLREMARRPAGDDHDGK